MLDWIVENRFWLFSGVAVSIPIAIVGWFMFTRKSTHVQGQKSGKNSVNIQAGGD